MFPALVCESFLSSIPRSEYAEPEESALSRPACCDFCWLDGSLSVLPASETGSRPLPCSGP